MKKKVLATLLAAALAVTSLVGCGKKPATGSNNNPSQGGTSGGNTAASLAGTYDITVWVPELAVDLTKKQIDDFNSKNDQGIKFNATIEAVSESEAATSMLQDVTAGADIFFFAQDQAARLIQSGGLAKLGVAAAESVASANSAGVVAATKAGDEMYAYPLTEDNGYFMYYDKSVIPEEDVDSFEKLLADCEAAGKTFTMEAHTGAWYIASWFFGTGCDSAWKTDDEGKFVDLTDNFNSDKGLIAAKGLYKFVSSPAYNSESTVAAFQNAVPAAVVVSGTWDYETAVTILGENLGVADLPSFEVDGNYYHMGSYSGSKLLGVKPQTDAARQAALHQLAQYLVSEEGQLERFNALSWGPANTNAKNNDAVQSNPALVALGQQNNYARPQGQIHGSWWDIAKKIGTYVMESDGSDEGLKAALQMYEDECRALFNMTDDEKTAWSVIGGINGTMWDQDFPMTRTAQTGVATFYSELMLLNEGETFKCRQGASWDVNFGDPESGNPDGNAVVPATGYYYVKLVYDDVAGTGIVTLEKSSFYGWSVIGSILGDGWTVDVPMCVQEDGTTFKTEALDLNEGEEFKVRFGASWDVNYGADGQAGGANVVVPATGTYTIVFDSTTCMITLE